MIDAPLLLASRSPRRQQLLREAGIEFEVIDSGIDDAELLPGDIDHRTWTATLAYLKAESARRLHKGRATGVVLGADTMVVKNGRLLGQPTGEAAAREMIALLEDGSHSVVTGVALIDMRTGIRRTGWDEATVTVGTIGADRIDQYISEGGWRGKAGGYNLSERQEAGWPVSCKGDPATVMGLPVTFLQRLLAEFRRELSKT